jgi:hypothetical protein
MTLLPTPAPQPPLLLQMTEVSRSAISTSSSQARHCAAVHSTYGRLQVLQRTQGVAKHSREDVKYTVKMVTSTWEQTPLQLLLLLLLCCQVAPMLYVCHKCNMLCKLSHTHPVLNILRKTLQHHHHHHTPYCSLCPQPAHLRDTGSTATSTAASTAHSSRSTTHQAPTHAHTSRPASATAAALPPGRLLLPLLLNSCVRALAAVNMQPTPSW